MHLIASLALRSTPLTGAIDFVLGRPAARRLHVSHRAQRGPRAASGALALALGPSEHGGTASLRAAVTDRFRSHARNLQTVALVARRFPKKDGCARTSSTTRDKLRHPARVARTRSHSLRLEHRNSFSVLGTLGNRARLRGSNAQKSKRILYVRESRRRTITQFSAIFPHRLKPSQIASKILI